MEDNSIAPPDVRKANSIEIDAMRRALTSRMRASQIAKAAHNSETSRAARGIKAAAKRHQAMRSALSESIKQAAREMAAEVRRSQQARECQDAERRTRSRVSVRGRSRAARCGHASTRTKVGGSRSSDPDQSDPARPGSLASAPTAAQDLLPVSLLLSFGSGYVGGNVPRVRQFQGGIA